MKCKSLSFEKMKKNGLLNKLNKIHESETQKEIEKAFDKIAEEIFNKHRLVVKNKKQEIKYRITEIEFYYYDKCIHPDPYVHQNEKQLCSGKWYFHGSGIDITFGNRTNFGGILIRGIQNTEKTYDYIDGPLLVKERMTINGLNLNGENVFNENMPNYIKALSKKILPMKTYSAPRVLKPSNKEMWHDYIMKNYRYLIHPEKTKNGKELLILSMIKNRTDNIYFYYVLKKTLVNYEKYYKKGYDLRKNNEKEKDAEDIINETYTDFGVKNRCKLYGLLNEGDEK